MTASTAEELGNDLDDSFQWRRTELATLKSDVEKVREIGGGRPRDRMVLRSAVVMLYAHWEGFVREACQGYLDFVAVRRLKYQELNDALLHTTLSNLASKAERDSNMLAELALAVRNGGAGRARFPRAGVVETKSNLRFEVTAAILERLGLPLGMIGTRAQLIDRKLCDARNEIAHGKTMFPRRDDVLSLHADVIEMMEHVRDVVLQAAAGRKYRHDGA